MIQKMVILCVIEERELLLKVLKIKIKSMSSLKCIKLKQSRHSFRFCSCSFIYFWFYYTMVRKEIQNGFSVLWICWDLFCRLSLALSWRTFHMILRKECILQLLDRVFCKYLLGLFSLGCNLTLMIFHFPRYSISSWNQENMIPYL